MGNLFGGATEELLLYVVIPLLVLTFLAASVMLERAIRGRLRVHAMSWRHAPTRDVDYRSSAQDIPRTPRTVRWLSRSIGVWGIGVAVLWVFVGICLTEWTSAYLAFLLPVVGLITLLPLAQTPLALCDRNAAGVPSLIQGARMSILVHHSILVVLATALLGLFFLSHQFFWNGSDEHRTGQLIDFCIAYGVLVIPSSLVGLTLVRWLQSVRPLYPA